MYKVLTSFWSKSVPNKSSTSTGTSIDEDSWVFVSTVDSPSMTNSWIASPPLVKTDEQPPAIVHHFNPIENLLIEHASMSVYEQIALKAHQKKTLTNTNEQTEDDDDDDGRDDETVSQQAPLSNLTSIHQRLTLESSLVAHHRHLQRLYQRRKRSKPTNETKQILDRQRLRSIKPTTRSSN